MYAKMAKIVSKFVYSITRYEAEGIQIRRCNVLELIKFRRRRFLLRGLVRRYMLCLSVVRLDDLSLVVVAVVVIVVIVVVAVVVPNWTFFLSLMRCRLSRVTQNKRHSVPLRRFFRLN